MHLGFLITRFLLILLLISLVFIIRNKRNIIYNRDGKKQSLIFHSVALGLCLLMIFSSLLINIEYLKSTGTIIFK